MLAGEDERYHKELFKTIKEVEPILKAQYREDLIRKLFYYSGCVLGVSTKLANQIGEKHEPKQQ